MGRKLYIRKPCNPSPRLLGLAYIAPARCLRVTCGALLPYFLTSLGTTVLATQSIEARARQDGRASLYDWNVYKRGSKARERKGEEEQRRLMFYTILASRNRNLWQSVAIY